MVVVMVIGMALLLAMPNFMVLSDEPLKREAMKVGSLLRYENDQAITRKESRAIRFDLDASTWEILKSNGEVDRSGRLENNVRILDLVTPTKGVIDRGTETIYFSPEGLASPAVIHLTDPDGALMSVVVHPYTALVETHEGYFK